MPSHPLKVVLIIGDGMADRQIRELKNRTPLEVASTPNMDYLASKGITGIMDVIEPGIPPGSAPAHLALLGYNPYEVYTGRGAFEALGAGLALGKGDVALRCNFATVNDDLVVVDRRAGRYIDEADELEKVINQVEIESEPNIKIIFKHTTEHRGVLVLKGANLSPQITNTDPGKTGLRIQSSKPLVNEPAAIRTAKIINEFTSKIYNLLRNHPINLKRISMGKLPANILLCRGAGVLPEVKSFEEKFGLKAACIAGIPLIKGVCKALGFNVINVPGATGGLDSNLNAKAEAALKALKLHDFVVISVKGTDAASHDGLINEKIKMIERIDSMIGRILDSVNIDEICIAVTADHATPISIRDHVGDPVPVLIFAPTIIPDDVAGFSERNALKGGLGRIKGVNLLPLLLNYSLRAKKFGE